MKTENFKPSFYSLRNYECPSKLNHFNSAQIGPQKDRREAIHSIGVLDIEKSQLPGIQEKPWQTDTCIGNWFYDAKQVFKRPSHNLNCLAIKLSC